jgi:hypothetical protein
MKYVCSKKYKILCEATCYHVNNIKEENKVWFDTIEEGLRYGCRLCKHCLGKRDNLMDNFCRSVIDFLQAEYSDAYEYKLEKHVALPPSFAPYSFPKVELWVKFDPHYTLKVANDNMQYLFHLYNSGEYIEERGQYLWQKELVDMIEGS